MGTNSDLGQDSYYEFTDLAGTDPLYIGEVASTGEWKISKYSGAAKTMRYCVGNSAYTTNWTGRVLLTYSLPNEV